MTEQFARERVTWLLPVKNGMPYLPETLASLAGQTDTNWEVLAWDNGSDDGTPSVLHEWIPSRLPGRVVTDRPMGLGLCRAAMVQEAQTELCACCDADDVSFPERLAQQIAFLRAHPDVALVGAQTVRLDTEGSLHGQHGHLPLMHEDMVQWLLLPFGNPIAQPTVLFRRAAVLAAGNYRAVGPVNIEDYELWLRMAAQGHKMANLNVPLVQYRVHPRSTTQQAIAEDRLHEAVRGVFLEHAPALFGLPAEELRALWERRHPCAIAALARAARSLARTQPPSPQSGWISRLRSRSLWVVGQAVAAPNDRVTRWALQRLQPGQPTLPRRALRLGGRIWKRLAGGGGV